MTRRRILRALGWSVLVSAVVALVAAILMEGFQGPWEPDTLLQVTGLFTLIFAVVAAGVCLPGFLLIERLAGGLLRRSVAVVAGGLIAPAATLVIAVLFFQGRSASLSVGDLLRFWSENLAAFALGIAPFVVSGAAFGFVWSASDPEPGPTAAARRPRASRRHA